MSKITVHHALLVLLTMTSGCVDAISFVKLGQVFTAAMTGNTVLFGLAVAHAGGLSVLGYAVALLGFIFGVAVGAVILHRSPQAHGWNISVTFCLTVEMIILILFAIVTRLSTPTTALHSPVKFLLIAILATAMGIQGVTARRIGVNGVTTTVITSTLTGLVETLVWKGVRILRSADSLHGTAAAGKNSPTVVSISMWIIVVIFYGIGAGVCGAFMALWHFQVIWLPISIVFVVVVTATAASIFSSVVQSERTDV